MQYKNPILKGFHPDPSICRDDEGYYYIATSTFEYFPGVPIYRSRDLINWQLLGHCLTRRSQLDLDRCPPSGGVFAPTIRYRNDKPAKSRILLDDLYFIADMSDPARQLVVRPDYERLDYAPGTPVTMSFRLRNARPEAVRAA